MFESNINVGLHFSVNAFLLISPESIFNKSFVWMRSLCALKVLCQKLMKQLIQYSIFSSQLLILPDWETYYHTYPT